MVAELTKGPVIETGRAKGSYKKDENFEKILQGEVILNTPTPR